MARRRERGSLRGRSKGAKWRWMVMPVTRSHVETEKGLGNVIALWPRAPQRTVVPLFLPLHAFRLLSLFLSRYTSPPTLVLFIAHTRPVHNINMLHLWPHLLHRVREFLRCPSKERMSVSGANRDWYVLGINWLVCHAG